MALFSFAIGLTLRRGEQLLEFRRKLDGGYIQFEDPLTGQLYRWEMSKIYREINSGELHIFRGDRDTTEGTAAPMNQTGRSISLLPSLDSLPEKYRSDIDRKMDYINACKRQGITLGQRNRIKTFIPKIANRRKEKAPAASSVMRWWRTLETHDQYPGSIISRNYRRRRENGIGEEVRQLIRKIAIEEYFTRKRYPLSRTKLLVNQKLAELKDSPKASEVLLKVEPVSLSTVRRVVNEVGPYYRDLARYGAAFARNKWRFSLKGNVTTRVMERLEIDHTLLDLVVVCDRTGIPLGRPTLTVVIDSYSGYVLAFFVSFWGTGVGPTLNALKVAISPKTHYCEGISGMTNPWLGYGLCELIVVDNGLEFHSPQFKLAGWHLNADIQYCAVRQPWLKPSVERALGVQGLYLPAAGKVHKPENNYLPPDPKKTACLTLSQLSIGLLKCFVDIMPMEPNPRTLIEPFELYREGFELLPPPLLPDSFAEMDLIGAMSKKLTLGNEGIVFNYLRYNSYELQDLRRAHSHSCKTLVKYHPEDLDFVYVQDPSSKDWLMVPSCQPEYTQSLSIVQHHAIRRHKKGELNKRNALEKLIQGKLELIDLYDSFLRGNRANQLFVKTFNGNDIFFHAHFNSLRNVIRHQSRNPNP